MSEATAIRNNILPDSKVPLTQEAVMLQGVSRDVPKTPLEINQDMLRAAAVAIAFGNAPFQQPFDARSCQINGMNGKKLPLLAQLALSEQGQQATDNRWITKAQLKEGGWQPKEGAKGVKIAYFADTVESKDKDGNKVALPLLDPELRKVTVYNMADTNCTGAAVKAGTTAMGLVERTIFERFGAALMNMSKRRELAALKSKKNLGLDFPPGSDGKLVVDLAGQMAAYRMGIKIKQTALSPSEQQRLISNPQLVAQSLYLSDQMANFVTYPENRPEIEAKVNSAKQIFAGKAMGAAQQAPELDILAQPQKRPKVQEVRQVVDDPKTREYLHVPFAQKDAAHELGAVYDGHNKQWYLPQHLSGDKRFEGWREKAKEPTRTKPKTTETKKTRNRGGSGR